MAALWQAIAACTVQRMDVLHERLLHMTYSCPAAASALPRDSLAASTEPAAAATAKDPKKAQVSRVSTDMLLKKVVTDELTALTGALRKIFSLDEELRSTGAPGIACIGQLAKQSFSKMLRYAQRPGERRRLLLTMMQTAAAGRAQAWAQVCAEPSARQSQQHTSLAGTGSHRPAEPCRAGAAGDETLSLAAAAQQLLKGKELWEDPHAAFSLQTAVELSLIQPARDLRLLFTADEAAISASFPLAPQGSVIRHSPAKQNGSRHDDAIQSRPEIGHVGAGLQSSTKDMLASKRKQSGAQSASGPQQAQRAADSLKLVEGMAGAAVATEIFQLLNRMPLQWPTLHEPSARHLLTLSLRFHKLVSRTLEAASTPSEASRAAAGTGCEPVPAMQMFVSSATALSGSILSFIARLAASGSKGLADDLAGASADSGLHWPYLAVNAAKKAIPMPLPGIALRPQAGQAQDGDAELILKAAAVIMYHSSRHAFTSQYSPASSERTADNSAVQALEAWEGGLLHSLQPGSPAQQLGSSRAQQLEVVCAALRSVAAIAVPSTLAPAQHSLTDTSAGVALQFFRCHCLSGVSHPLSMQQITTAATNEGPFHLILRWMDLSQALYALQLPAYASRLNPACLRLNAGCRVTGTDQKQEVCHGSAQQAHDRPGEPAL